MNLEDVIDPEYGLQQDEWSLSKPRFGKDNQLTVIGWSGRTGNNKYYIVKCELCCKDTELFGEGYFKSSKRKLLKAKQLPCGCSKAPRRSVEQYAVLCSRKAEELGYKFLGFMGEWCGRKTKLKMVCDEHGEWSSGVIGNLLNNDTGCPECRREYMKEVKKTPDNVMITAFLDTGAFHPDTKFWRSDRLNNLGWRAYWNTLCPVCGEVGESISGDLRKGHRPCACSPMRQQEAYINLVMDSTESIVAIKFGIARDSRQRIKGQNSRSIYKIKNYLTYKFPDVESCKNAERACKKKLECGVLLRSEMPDGYTETTF